MNKLRCAILDDEPIARNILADFIRPDERLELLGSYKNATEAIAGISKEPVELVFLDINMPGFTGFQFLKSLTQPPGVIFTTAYREHAMEGFEANAIDYLLKPFSQERFLVAVDKAWKYMRQSVGEKEPDFFFVKADGGLVKIITHQILYVEALKEYVRIVTPDKTVVTYHTLTGLEEKLPTDTFYRVHRSFIVNISAVTSIEAFTVKIGDHEIPVSRNERDGFLTRVANGRIISK